MSDEEESSKEIVDNLTILRQKLYKLEKEFNKARHEFFNKTRSYYSQSIGSNYIKENDILKLLLKCKLIKNEYNRVKKLLLDSREKPERWTFRSSFVYTNQSQEYEENHD